MKRLLLLASVVIGMCVQASAQYHYIPYLNAGNPKGLNQDYDDDAYYLSDWIFILQDSAVDVWSAVQTLPFPFEFNGSAVTQFKVSTSGVITFTTSAPTAPPTGNVSLPSANVPDKSICLLGLTCLGQNDIVCTKTFGTAPHRQFWIDFASFSYPSVPGYNYWSVALEETTNNIYIVDKGSYTSVNLSLGIQVSSTEAYMVAGSPNVHPIADDYLDNSDNTYYMFLPGVQPADEIELTSLNIKRFTVMPGNVNISGSITNYGSTPITSYVVKYQEGNNAVQSYTRSSVNVTLGKTNSFTHNIPLSVTNAVPYNIKAWVELPNDLNHANDTLSGVTNGVSFAPVKNIVFEEGTGTWCGWCPRGAVYMDSLYKLHPDRANLIAVHNADPMTISNYDGPFSNLLGGYPDGMIDRKTNLDPLYFIAAYNQYINDVVPCEVTANATYNTSSRQLTIDATTHFGTAFTGDFRFNAVVTEDSVSGTGSTWGQRNYYSYSSQNIPLNGAGKSWQTEPDPVPANKMTYNHVARAILGGFNGSSGSIPSPVADNGIYTKTFTYTVPNNYNINRLKVVVWVSNLETDEIYNSTTISSIVGLDEQELSNRLLIYPNPSSGLVKIQSAIPGNAVMKLNVVNALGQTVVAIDNFDLNGNNLWLDLSKYGNGLYYLHFTDADNRTAVSKVMINQ